MPLTNDPIFRPNGLRFSEPAIAILRTVNGDELPSAVSVEFEGSLHDLVAWYAKLPASRQAQLFVHLSDRKVRPYRISADEMKQLCHVLDPTGWHYKPTSTNHKAD